MPERESSQLDSELQAIRAVRRMRQIIAAPLVGLVVSLGLYALLAIQTGAWQLRITGNLPTRLEIERTSDHDRTQSL
jgi:hypothetical protein